MSNNPVAANPVAMPNNPVAMPNNPVAMPNNPVVANPVDPAVVANPVDPVANPAAAVATVASPVAPAGNKNIPGRRGNTSTRALGQSESSMNTQTSALKWANHIFSELEMNQFEDITAKDVENEELELIHHQLIGHAALYPYTDEKEKEGSRKVASAATIVNYFGIIKNLLRKKFPKHPEWPQSPSDNPLWYKECVANFKKEYERSARTWSEDDYHRGSNKITALYRYNHTADREPDDLHTMALWYGKDMVGEGPTPSFEMGRDLNTISINLFRNATPLKPESYREIHRTLITAATCCRSQECKYMSWSSVKYEATMEVISFEKPQQKTLTTGRVCVAVNPKNPFNCPVMGFSQHIFPGQGLRRNAAQRECNAKNRIFPDEFHFSSSQVTRRATATLKSGLPKSISKEGRDSLSAKSLRMGFITEISIHPFSSNEDVIGMSGHKSGNNTDNYKDVNSCVRSYRAAKMWSEHENMERPVCIPKPHWLGNPDIKPIFDHLYHVALGACEVAEFEVGGRLYHLGQYLLCMPIMWYCEIRERFGDSNGLVIWLHDLFKHCKVVDPDEPELTPKLVLEKWSIRLWEEFQRQNDHVHNQDFSTYTMQQLVVAVQGNVRRLAAMERQMSRILKTEPHLSEDFAALARNQRDILLSINKALSDNRNLLNKYVDDRELKSSEEKKRKAREEVYNTPGSRKKSSGMESPPSVQYLTTIAAPVSSTPPVTAAPELDQLLHTQPNEKKARSGSPVFNTTNNYTVNSSNVHFSGTGTGPRSEQSNFAAIPSSNLAFIPSFAIGKAELKQTIKHRKAVDELMRSRKAQKPSKEGLGGTVLLHEHLQRQHQCGAYESAGPLCRPHDEVPQYCLNDQAKHHYTMEACDALLSKRYIDYLKGPYDPRHKGIYEEMQQEVMDGMLRLEGEDPEAEKELAGKIAGKKKRASISALGRRVKDYKNLVRQNMPSLPKVKNGRYDNTPLHPRSMWETNVGTPPGNTSIAKFFGGKKRPLKLDLEQQQSPTEEDEQDEEQEQGGNIL